MKRIKVMIDDPTRIMLGQALLGAQVSFDYIAFSEEEQRQYEAEKGECAIGYIIVYVDDEPNKMRREMFKSIESIGMVLADVDS